MANDIDIVLPLVNINGSGATYLKECHSDALDAIRASISALKMTAPHGRDYRNWDETFIAVQQYSDRLTALESIERDLKTTLVHIQYSSRR